VFETSVGDQSLIYCSKACILGIYTNRGGAHMPVREVLHPYLGCFGPQSLSGTHLDPTHAKIP